MNPYLLILTPSLGLSPNLDLALSLGLVPDLDRAPVACVPGRDGVPDSLPGHLLCGDWTSGAPDRLWQTLHTWWPLLLAAAAVLAGLAVGWQILRRRVWYAHARRARWLAIVPPAAASPAATVGLWRLLATVLPSPPWWALRPARLVWEVHAGPDGMRCGLWTPPGVNPTAVTRLLQRAWPGARTTQARPPTLDPDRPAAGVAVGFTRPQCQSLVDDPPDTHSGRRRDGTVPVEDDRLRAVYDGLAAAGRTGGGLLQVHVCRAPRRRVAALRRATARPDRVARGARRGALQAVGVFVEVLRRLTITVLDVVTPGPGSHSHPRQHVDLYAADLARQARVKYADAPHLLVCVRAVATGPTRAAARAAADDITGGYALLCAHCRRRRLYRPATTARRRWIPEAAMSLAGVCEVAALAGLPAEPAAYGLPAAASRRLPASRDVFTTPTTRSRPRPRPRPRPRSGPGGVSKPAGQNRPTARQSP